MTGSETPICDLIEELLSQGLSPGTVLIAAKKVEASTARASGSDLSQRERWRLKKAWQRKQKRGLSPGTTSDPILSSKTQNDIKKKESRCPLVPGDKIDDWPVDYVDIFWKAFPPYRRQARVKVAAKLARIRVDGKVTWETLLGGVLKFASTNPGEFAPAPMVWLNDGRWDREYGGKNGNAINGHRTDSGTGRATAREANQVAVVGAAALRYLEESKSAGSRGDSSGGAGVTGGFDFGSRSKAAR